VSYRRVFVIVLDGCGIGSAPDAACFGDEGSDTLGNLAREMQARGKPLSLPVLATLGLGNLYESGLPGIAPDPSPTAHHARLTELSPGKDSTTGHWELMGLPRTLAAPLFPEGFPPEMLASLTAATGKDWLGNRAASGTAIIAELGAEHLECGKLILYTSGDSVLQIAAHVDLVPLSELYDVCETARAVLRGDWAVDRVIARPFTGTASEGFTRSVDRRDFSIPPPGTTVLDELCAQGFEVLGIGKIGEMFAGRGLTRSIPVHGNRAQMQQVEWLVAPMSQWRGLCFANLVDFDMLFGHRNDVAGFAAALEEFDAWLGAFLSLLLPDDLLLITADHGNDPTTPSTDHSREQVPLLIHSRGIAAGGGHVLTPAAGFYHVGASVCAALGARSTLPGESCV
jgi:phosphopentomutase